MSSTDRAPLHIGLICIPAVGHLHTMLPLGYELRQRGHRVTLFGVPDVEEPALTAGLAFQPMGAAQFPLGTMVKLFRRQGQLRGAIALQYTLRWARRLTRACLEEAPAALKTAGIEGLIIDQNSYWGGTVAELLDLPFVTVCSALMLNWHLTIPPFFTGWPYNPTLRGKFRNLAGYLWYYAITRPNQTLVASYRRAWQLPLHRDPNRTYSQLAQLSQYPAEFEYPRTDLPPPFHFTGPYHNDATRPDIPFPYDRLTGQPLIYASMGTLQNRLRFVFVKIAEACQDLDAQLVLSLGDAMAPETLPALKGNPLVVPYAPQLELLKRATLVITHGGMNTTLECLKQGVPMVAIPVTNDQPGVAARIAWTGVGETIPVGQLRVGRLRRAIEQVLTTPSYRQHALRLQAAIQRAGGAQRAADIVEQAITTRQPILAHP